MAPATTPASERDSTALRRSRLTGVLALAAALGTILLASLAITALALAENRVRAALAAQQSLDGAVAEAAACATVFAARTDAWKTYLLAEIRSDSDAAQRAKSALATTSGALHERLESLVEVGVRAGLPTEDAARAARHAGEATALLVDAIADTRGADDAAHAEADRRTMDAIEEVQFALSAVHANWSRHATGLRLEATAAAAESARRIKAWIEILSLIAVTLVLTIGALAVRKDASRGSA